MLMRRAKNGELDAIETLYVDNLGLINTICRKFSFEQNDLLQESYFSLLKAISTYNENYDCKFSSYFAKRLVWDLINYCQKNRNDCLSLNAPISEDSELTLLDTIADENPLQERTEVQNIFSIVHAALDSISDRKRAYAVYYVDGCQHPQKVVAKLLGVSGKYIGNLRMSGRIELRKDINMQRLWEEYGSTEIETIMDKLRKKGVFL